MPRRRNRRVPVDSGIGPASREPVVRQNDPFLPFTGQGAAGGLEDLARGLSGFSRELEGLFGDRQRRAQERDLELGKQAYLDAQASQQDFVKLQREGAVSPDKNPWRRMGWQLSAGADTAMRYNADLTVAAATGLKEATSMDEVREFERKFRNDWVDANVPEEAQTEAFLNGFNPALVATLSDFNREWARKVTEGFLSTEADTLGREVSGKLDKAMDAGYDMQTIGAALTEIADRAYAGGQNPKATETVLRSVLSYAESINSYQLLDALKFMEGGQPGDRWRVYDTPRFKDLIDETEDAIAGDITRKINLQENERSASIEEAYRPLEDRLNEDLAKNQDNPYAVDVDEYVREATDARLPAEKIDRLRTIWRAAANRRTEGDELREEYYFRQIVDSEDDDFRELRYRIVTDTSLNTAQLNFLLNAMDSGAGGARRSMRALDSDIKQDLRLIWKPELVQDFDRGASMVNAVDWVQREMFTWLKDTELDPNDPAVVAQKHRLYKTAIMRFWPPQDARNRQAALDALSGGTSDLVRNGANRPFVEPIMRRDEAAELLREYEDVSSRQAAGDGTAHLSDDFVQRMDDLGLDQYLPENATTLDRLELYERILRAQVTLGATAPGPRR